MHPLRAGALLVILALASFASSFLPLHAWALPVALAVAALKAGIVLFAFMSFGREAASVQLAALAALLMLLLLTGLMLADPLTREPAPVVGLPTSSAREMLVSGHGHEQ